MDQFRPSEHNNVSAGLLNFTAALIAVSLVVYILIISNAILLPLVVAIVIWFIITRFASLFAKIPVVGSRTPNWFSIILAVIATGLILYGFVHLVRNSIYGIIEQVPLYQEKLNSLIALLNGWLGTHIEIEQFLSKLDLTELFSNLAVTVTNIVSNIGIIAVYVLFITLEYKTFDSKIRALAGSEENMVTTLAIIDRINSDINTYIRIKTGVSVLTALLSYIALASYGIPFAEFWATLIFVLNFIPTLGSVIAVAVTVLAISIQFASFASLAILTLILTAIQIVVGNILEPKLMGKNLNLSPLVILLSLAFWGSIWGVIGMFLCIPLMTIINIVMSRFPKTRKLAAMLAADPNIFVSKSSKTTVP